MKFPWRAGNRLRLLINGEAFFPECSRPSARPNGRC